MRERTCGDTWIDVITSRFDGERVRVLWSAMSWERFVREIEV